MIKETYYCFKQGLYVAVASFTTLYRHPLLLAYYGTLFLIYSILFIVTYNIIGYHSSFLMLTDLFQMSNHNVTIGITPQSNMLMYALFLGAIFLNIFFRNLIDVALIKHAYSIEIGEKRSILQSLRHASTKMIPIIQWTIIVTALTVIAHLISLLQLNSWLVVFIIALFSFVWTAITFFILPIIALTHKNIIDGIKSSAQYTLALMTKICGGMLWIYLIYLLATTTASIVQFALMPGSSTAPLFIAAFFIIHVIFSSVTLIFKTKLYLMHLNIEITPAKEHFPPDYSQF